MTKRKLIDKLDTMLLRTIADIHNEWKGHEVGEDMKTGIREAYAQIKSLIEGKVSDEFVKRQAKKMFDDCKKCWGETPESWEKCYSIVIKRLLKVKQLLKEYHRSLLQSEK